MYRITRYLFQKTVQIKMKKCLGQVPQIKINLLSFIKGIYLASQILSTYQIRRISSRYSIKINLYKITMRLKIFKKPQKNLKIRHKFKMALQMILASKSKIRTLWLKPHLKKTFLMLMIANCLARLKTLN